MEVPVRNSDSPTIIDDQDYEKIKGLSLSLNTTKDGQRYVRTYGNGRTSHLHRVLLNPPKGLWTDHKDGNGLNNRRSNLRVCTPYQNCCNKRSAKGSASRYLGVWYSNHGKRLKRWVAEVRKDRKRVYQEYFLTEIEAARAYDQAAQRHHGEYARMNNA